MIVIGLTGGIASGKSTVANYLAKLGAKIIDADKLARELVFPGSQVLKEIEAAFGGQVIQGNGELDRQALGELIFSDAAKREQLDQIMIPKIIDQTEDLLNNYRKAGIPVVVIDAPLLFEVKMTNIVDYVWVVYVPAAIQIKRLIHRDQLTMEQAQKRLLSQLPIEEKKALADHVIENVKDISYTFQQVEALWQELLHKR